MHNIYPNLWQQTTPDGDPNPFLDIRVRQAANHAINRRAIIDNLFLGVGDMSMLVYSGVPGYPSPEQKGGSGLRLQRGEGEAAHGRGRL